MKFRRPELDAVEIERRRPGLLAFGAEPEVVEEGRKAVLEVFGSVSGTA